MPAPCPCVASAKTASAGCLGTCKPARSRFSRSWRPLGKTSLSPWRACFPGTGSRTWCAQAGRPCGLGHALSMNAIHGGKAKNDQSDAQKIAVLLRGGLLPPAYGAPARGVRAHLRVLNVSPQQRHDKLSCHLVPSVRGCLGSLLQPRAYCGFLMHPLPWTSAQKAAQARQARLEARCRPSALYLLPQGVQPQPAQQPTAHHQRLGWGGGTQERPELCGRVFVQRPRDEQCSNRRFHTGRCVLRI